jgi:hypothetical protein
MWGAPPYERTDLSFTIAAGLASADILGSESRGTDNHTLLYHIRDAPNLEGQVPMFTSPSNRMAQFYPQVLSSLFVASYDSQGWERRIRNRLKRGPLTEPDSELESESLYDWRFTANYFILEPNPLRLTTTENTASIIAVSFCWRGNMLVCGAVT